MTRLIDNLLAYSRISDVTEAYTFEAVPVGSLLSDSLKEFELQLRTAGFTVTVDVQDGLPLLFVDPQSMGLAISNLIDNAIRYSADRRELTLSAQADPAGVRIAVRDAGRGIPEHELALVARKFFRGRDSGSGGSGLGLYITQQIVRDHGGALTISSRPHEGTTVTLTLRGATADDEETDPDR